MRCLSLVPDHLFRARRTACEEPGLVFEVISNYKMLRALASASRQRLEQIQELSERKQLGMQSHAHFFSLRAHALNAAVLIILNRVLFALDATANWDIFQEAKELSNEILSLARDAEQYAPLGSFYIAFCLCTAWIGFSDGDQRNLVESLLLDFYNEHETATLVDVLRVKVQDLENLRVFRFEGKECENISHKRQFFESITDR